MAAAQMFISAWLAALLAFSSEAAHLRGRMAIVEAKAPAGPNAVEAQREPTAQHAVGQHVGLENAVKGSSFAQTESNIKSVQAAGLEEDLTDVLTDEEQDILNQAVEAPTAQTLPEAPDGGAEEKSEDEDAEVDAEVLVRVGRKMDVNSDGLLSRAELQQFAKDLQTRQFRQTTTQVLKLADSDGDGKVTLREMLENEILRKAELAHQELRFAAADDNDDGALDQDELHQFLHLQLGGKVLEAEVTYQLSKWDKNTDGRLSTEEFFALGAAKGTDWNEEVGQEDFALHDLDKDEHLDFAEFMRLLQGHDLLNHSIEKVIQSIDIDGDGHMHLEDEVTAQIGTLMESEYVEDYFFHPHAEGRAEL